jgi:glycosyl transferase family 9 (putative heptosyltransferase)
VRLLSGLKGAERVIAHGDPLPAFDCYCPMMSLPRILGTTLAAIPADVPYLSADRTRIASWRNRLAGLSGLRIGLAWAGNPNLDDDRQRSIPLDRLAELAGVAGVAFVSLQKGETAMQTGSLRSGMVVHDWTDELDDFAETAALIENLDLVISVDTSTVHLAGALGKPVWLLNRFDTCWRWLLDRNDSPWYPTLRQFRQPQRDDWSSVIKNVRAALERRVAENSRPPLP